MWSCVCYKQLVSISIICIENEVAISIDLVDLMNNFIEQWEKTW